MSASGAISRRQRQSLAVVLRHHSRHDRVVVSNAYTPMAYIAKCSISANSAAATAQWQDIQTLSTKTVNAAGNIANQIAAEAKGFSEFLTRSNDGEKANLRLEIEKLRRGEKDLLQVVIHLMDHCFALFQAAMASGQPQLIQQIGNYRNACIDATRRVGILPYEAQAGEPFDTERHEIADGSEPTPGATVERTVAWGYTFQGVGIRRIQVAIAATETAATEN